MKTEIKKYYSKFEGIVPQQDLCNCYIYFDRRALMCFRDQSDAKYFLRFGDNVIKQKDCYKILSLKTEESPWPGDFSRVITSMTFQNCFTEECITVQRTLNKRTVNDVNVQITLCAVEGLSGEMLAYLKPFLCDDFKNVKTGSKVYLELVSEKRKFTNVFTNKFAEGIVIDVKNDYSLLIDIPSIKKTILLISTKKFLAIYDALFPKNKLGVNCFFQKKVKISH